MEKLRPSDLAREHGISAQAVRNYEAEGFLPQAERTPSGYRVYTAAHAAALRAYLALVRAHGHAVGGQIMYSVHNGDIDEVLLFVDRGHERLSRDRATLDAVRLAVAELTDADPGRDEPTRHPFGIGELAHRLKVTPATLRNWEDAGILAPLRDRPTGYRVYGPADVRDAELAHLLRRGGYPLEHIAAVVEQIREAGGTEALSRALADWRRRLTERGLAMLAAAARLHEYLDRRQPLTGSPGPHRPGDPSGYQR